LACAGCTGGAPGPAKVGGTEGILRRPASELPKVGEYSPYPLDESLLEVAPPVGWTELPPKQGAYLTGFAAGDESELPRITISAESAPKGLQADLTEKNVPAAAAQLDEELRKAVSERRKRVEEPSLPIIIGETPFVRHVRQALQGGKPCVVQSLQTIRNGRLYTIELIVKIDPPASYKQALMDYRGQAYAVAAHMRFAPPGEKLAPRARFTPPPGKDADAKSKAPADGKSTRPKPAEPKAAEPKPPAEKAPPPKAAEKKAP
jgi:hypothetical protein